MSGVHQGTTALRRVADHTALAAAAREVRPSIDGLAAVWVKHDDPAADAVRAEEALVFPEVPELLTAEVEHQCMFVVIVDTQSGEVLHALRVSGPFIRHANGGTAQGSGFVIIDELIAESDSFTIADFQDRYDEATLAVSLSVETNFRIGERRELLSGARVAHLGYLAVFRLVERLRPDGGEALVFGAQNDATVRSLAALGLPAKPVRGLPEQRSDSDDVYRPKVISVTDATRAVFEALDPIALPETWLGDATWARAALGLESSRLPEQIAAQRSRGG